jgi:hypothetical protein
MNSTFGSPVLFMRESDKAVDPTFGHDHDITTSATIASIGPTFGDVPLTPKAHASVSAAAGDGFDLDSINEHVWVALGREGTGCEGMYSQKKDATQRRHPQLFALFGCRSIRNRHDVDTAAFAIKHHVTINQSEQGVVLALADVGAGVVLVTNLSDQDISCVDGFSAKLFDTASLGVGIATVATGALTFLMGH